MTALLTSPSHSTHGIPSTSLSLPILTCSCPPRIGKVIRGKNDEKRCSRSLMREYESWLSRALYMIKCSSPSLMEFENNMMKTKELHCMNVTTCYCSVHFVQQLHSRQPWWRCNQNRKCFLHKRTPTKYKLEHNRIDMGMQMNKSWRLLMEWHILLSTT